MADGAGHELMLDAHAIADALRISKRGVIKRAGKDAWVFQEAAVSGGKRRLYALDALPEDVRTAVLRHRAIEAASNLPKTAAETAGRQAARGHKIAQAVDGAVVQRARERGQANAAALTGKAAERMEAKLHLLAALDTFARSRGIGICAAMDEFCDAYNSGALDVPIAVRQHTSGDLSPSTLRRWRGAVKKQGAAALAGAYGNRKGSGAIDQDEELRDYILGVLAEHPTISAKLLHQALAAYFDEERVPVRRTLQRWLASWKVENAGVYAAIRSPDEWKNKFMPAHGSYSDAVVRVNQRWEMDSTPADVMLEDGRHSLIGVIDVRTRRMKLLVSRTSTSEAVCQLTRRAILAWGVPEKIKIDNGRDYASTRNAALLRGLDIEADFSAPFSPWEKPHIERGFHTFSHGLLTLMPGYIGHDVAEAQAIRARESFAERLFKKNSVVHMRMTAAELQAFCDTWCDSLYAHEPHAGLDGQSPFQVAAGLRDTVRMVNNVRALDVLMGAGQLCSVSKRGIRLDKLTYIAEELGALDVGTRVLVRRDDGDMGRIVVYHQDAFYCLAECPEMTGVSRKDVAVAARQMAKEKAQDARRAMRQSARRIDAAKVYERVLEDRAAQNATLAALPPPNVTHITPHLAEAARAADALAQWESGAPPAETPELRAAKFDDFARVARREQEADQTAEARFEDALQKLLRESTLNDIERRQLKVYMSSAEFTARWGMLETEGAEWLGLSADYNALLPADALYHHRGA